MSARSVNNDVYRSLGHAWWDEDVGGFSTIRFFVNPVRFSYFARVLKAHKARQAGIGARILDVGCGGGFLSEELARAGYLVTGVDPAPETIEAARAHAAAGALEIDYRVGSGEHLQFDDASFDHVVCCDVLEHVDDLERVISEVGRVLKPGGFFLYDTVNRTFLSKVAVIKLMQEWRSTAFAPPRSHVWERFVKPTELCGLLDRHGMDQQQMRGISPRSHPISLWLNLRRRAKGEITFKQLGERLGFYESDNLNVSYMGYAVKRGG